MVHYWGGGVEWDNNVHVPVRTQAGQAHHTRAERSIMVHYWVGGVEWDNNVHVPVRTQAGQAHHTRAERSSWFTIGGVGVAGKNTYYVARPFFCQNLPYVAQTKNTFSHTLLTDTL